jgi:hypothetical protein
MSADVQAKGAHLARDGKGALILAPRHLPTSLAGTGSIPRFDQEGPRNGRPTHLTP